MSEETKAPLVADIPTDNGGFIRVRAGRAKIFLRTFYKGDDGKDRPSHDHVSFPHAARSTLIAALRMNGGANG